MEQTFSRAFLLRPDAKLQKKPLTQKTARGCVMDDTKEHSEAYVFYKEILESFRKKVLSKTAFVQG
jgi:hypothetical protein